jgi:hypothetical protein
MSEIIDNMSAEEKKAVEPLASGAWLTEVKAAEKNLEKWHDQAGKIVRRFLDKRDGDEETNKLNLFTTNTNILIATLYAKFPKPMVTREFEDQADDVARVAATIIERMLKVHPRDDLDSGMKSVVQDRLVPGMGQLWLHYEPNIESGTTPAVIDPSTGQELSPAAPFEHIIDEKVRIDYVFWKDFLFSPARTWEQVRWVARRIKMSKPDATKRFGAVITARMTFSKPPTKDQGSVDGPDHDQLMEATVYEVWCKRSKKVYWVTPDLEIQLDQKPDTLRLKGFWPCPKPLVALTSTSNFVPRPDYLMAQDQYQELDTVNNRITWIERAIKVVGVYDGTDDEISRIFTTGADNKIIASRNFSAFAEKGGFKGAIDWLPIETLVNALDKLRTYRQDLITQIYEITGISDIMRGSSKASETLGAQQLKAQYGSVKLQFLQMEVASFVEEVLDIKAEIIRNHFQPDTIVRYSNIGMSQDQEFIAPAVQLVKSGEFDLRVQVHADSMAVPEFNAERDGRMAFIRAISEMMTAAAPILESNPGAGAAMLKVVQWGAGSFRTGYTIESILDKAIKGIEEAAKSPPAPPPPPPPEPPDQPKSLWRRRSNRGKTVAPSWLQIPPSLSRSWTWEPSARMRKWIAGMNWPSRLSTRNRN